MALRNRFPDHMRRPARACAAARYRARPRFALERLRQRDAEHLLYENTRPGPDGRGAHEPYHLRHRILRRNRQHHVHVIRHQMPLLDPTLLLLGQSPEHLPEVLPQLPV